VFWRVSGAGKRRGDAAQTSFSKKKRVKMGKKVKNLDKSKIQKTTLPDQASARRLRHDIGAM